MPLKTRNMFQKLKFWNIKKRFHFSNTCVAERTGCTLHKKLAYNNFDEFGHKVNDELVEKRKLMKTKLFLHWTISLSLRKTTQPKSM